MEDLDPDKVHYGTWYSLFLDSTEIEDDFGEQAMIRRLRTISRRYYCETCRGHFTEYLAKNPIDPYLARSTRIPYSAESKVATDYPGRRLGMFTWLWQCKNNVNRRLGKREVGYEEAWRLYAPGKVCTTCGISNIKDNNAPAPKTLSRMLPIADLLRLRNYQR